jgi:hypothetical protein
MRVPQRFLVCAACVALVGLGPRAAFRPDIPRTWDDAALAEWATPLAGINVRPTHISSKEYYALPVDNLKTYPVYVPDREPAGYWDMLQKVGPQPLIEPQKLTTEQEWIQAGRRVFEDADHIHLRTLDPQFINRVRDRDAIGKLRADTRADGTLPDLRWVPTEKGVALTFPSCSACHVQEYRDGRIITGAAVGGPTAFRATGLIAEVHYANRVVHANAPFIMAPGPIGERLYQAWGVPWVKNDIHEQLRGLTQETYDRMRGNYGRSGGLLRWNGSLYYPAKTPDLIGIQDRKYIDHTATHLHRNIGDLMRYAALVSFAESAEFGPHRVLAPGTTRASLRRSDEALYALALYIYSLKPPANPHPFDASAEAGQRLFTRERCVTCHTPPLYTSNKLTLAEGFTPPPDVPGTLDILRVSVGTDPGLALATRKGTGYYKVPSLKGVWYRARLLHDGGAAGLEEMFNPDRVKDGYVPGGWLPFGEKARPIRGHVFGLTLTPEERAQLLAFLRTL